MKNNNFLSAPFLPHIHNREQRQLLDAIAEKVYNVIDYVEELQGAEKDDDRRAIRENIRQCLYMLAHGVQRLSWNAKHSKTRALVLEVLEGTRFIRDAPGIDTAWEVSELKSASDSEYKTICDALNQALNLLDFFTVEELEKFHDTRKQLEQYLS